MSKSEDISHIAKDVLQTGKLTNEHVSELAKMTAKQIYTQGWNAAIEAAALRVEDTMQHKLAAYQIRELKK